MRLVEERRKRREAFLKLIKKHPGIERDQAIAMFSNETGISSVTIQRYLYELINAGLIRQEEVLEKVPLPEHLEYLKGRINYTFEWKTRLYPANPMHPLVEDLR